MSALPAAPAVPLPVTTVVVGGSPVVLLLPAHLGELFGSPRVVGGGRVLASVFVPVDPALVSGPAARAVALAAAAAWPSQLLAALPPVVGASVDEFGTWGLRVLVRTRLLP